MKNKTRMIQGFLIMIALLGLFTNGAIISFLLNNILVRIWYMSINTFLTFFGIACGLEIICIEDYKEKEKK